MSSIISVNDLTKVYRTYVKEPGFWGTVRGLVKRRYRETRAVDGVSFEIAPGELVGFLGPNGAGKTTVLKMLSGLLYPTSGTATVLGFTPWERADEFRRQFALVLGQKNQLWWDLPAAESLELNRVIYGLGKEEARKTLDELVEMLDVREQLHVMVRELSLGERMKMELVAALLHLPRVLFLDESTIGLDVVSQKKVREFLRDYTERHGITTLLTSHYMQDIEELCERVIIVDHGKIFFDGPLAQILERFANSKILALTSLRGLPSFDYEPYGEVLSQNKNEVQLRVPRKEMTRVSQALLGALEPDDISIEEMPIEEIIRQVFIEQSASVAAASPSP